MSAYIVIQSRIFDPEPMVDYKNSVLPIIANFGGRHIGRGSEIEALEGKRPDGRVSIIEFPTMEALHAFWHSPEYAEAKKFRSGAAEFDAWAVPGAG